MFQVSKYIWRLVHSHSLPYLHIHEELHYWCHIRWDYDWNSSASLATYVEHALSLKKFLLQL